MDISSYFLYISCHFLTFIETRMTAFPEKCSFTILTIRVNQTTRMSKQKTKRGQIAADVNQLMSVSSEGLGLIIIKLFLVDTNNINNHSVNLDYHKSDFEPGLVPKWDSCYVCWLFPLRHMVLSRASGQAVCLTDFGCLCYMVCSRLFIFPKQQ